MEYQKVFLLLIVCLIEFGKSSFYEDYCWRDFDEQIPSDAILGGMDHKGRAIHICQAVYDSKLLPGKLLAKDKNCYITSGSEEHAVNDSVQILCSKRPDKFQWMPVSFNQIHGLRNKRILEAGHERGFQIYIGRVVTDQEITVSKVTCWATGCEKLSAMNDGTMQQYDKFELLVYNLEFAEKESK